MPEAAAGRNVSIVTNPASRRRLYGRRRLC